MVSTSARNAGGPWFDSRSRHDRFLSLMCSPIEYNVIFYLYLLISKIEDGHFCRLTFYFSVNLH